MPCAHEASVRVLAMEARRSGFCQGHEPSDGLEQQPPAWAQVSVELAQHPLAVIIIEVAERGEPVEDGVEAFVGAEG